MPIRYFIDMKQYLEYTQGYKPVPPTATFEIDSSGQRRGYFDSYYPDPEIVTHAHGCPHAHGTYEYYYRKDQLPEGYVNEVTPDCLDFHRYNHAGDCYWHIQHIRERIFTDWLKEQGLPIFERDWVNPYDPTHAEKVYHCPLCATENQVRFGHCKHAQSIPGLGPREDYLLWLVAPQQHTDRCTEDCTWGYWEVCMPYGPRVIMTEYAGCVLDHYEHNGCDDSDFYAIWDEQRQAVREIEYASTRGAGGGSCQVDATPETIEKAFRYACRWFAGLVYDGSVRDSTRISVGRSVRVIKTVQRAKNPRNNVPEGMTGIVLQTQEGEWGRRVEFVDDDVGEATSADQWPHHHWVAEDKLVVIDPEQYIIDPADAWEKGVAMAEQVRREGRWSLVGYMPTPGTICAL